MPLLGFLKPFTGFGWKPLSILKTTQRSRASTQTLISMVGLCTKTISTPDTFYRGVWVSVGWKISTRKNCFPCSTKRLRAEGALNGPPSNPRPRTPHGVAAGRRRRRRVYYCPIRFDIMSDAHEITSPTRFPFRMLALAAITAFDTTSSIGVVGSAFSTFCTSPGPKKCAR